MIIKEMQIKSTVNYHLTSVRTAVVKKMAKDVSEYVEKREPSHCRWECKLLPLLWKTGWSFLKKLKLKLLYNPAIPLLGISEEDEDT